jgi:hypothetical protein
MDRVIFLASRKIKPREFADNLWTVFNIPLDGKSEKMTKGRKHLHQHVSAK